MNEKDLELLEFPQVREILAGFTSFSASRELALGLVPLSDTGQITLLLRQSAEARRLLSLEPGFSIGAVSDIGAVVKMAFRGKVLEPQSLLEVQETLALMRQLRDRLEKLADEVPSLWKIAKNLVGFSQLEKNILRCVSPSGELLDSASPELAALRSQLKQVRQQLLEQLKSTMESPQGQKLVQQPIITEREGRYVIPVKIEHRREIQGIVHDISNSEATAFIEPLVTVEMGNTMRELVVEESREVERILRSLSAEVGGNLEEISQNISIAAELDLALAKARYASSVKAAEPVLVPFDDNKATLKLIAARHPLLSGRAVPLSIEIGRDFSILVITGPNTGGKTVALKTIGLLSLMAQAGLPVPASPESRIPVFDGVYADIGDEQSIEQTLSTFSWHMSNITRILNSASHKSLVLLDELGTNTDPSEGSALARAILQHLLFKGTMTVTTSHYSELKAFAHVTAGLQNASFEFDRDTLIPTYKLALGIPGGSNAIATAARMGLPDGIVEAARAMLTKGAQELESLLADLSEEKDRQEVLVKDAEKQKKEAEQAKLELQSELKKLADDRNRLIQDARDEVTEQAAALHQEIQGALAELRRGKTKDRTEQAREVLARVRTRLKDRAFQPQQADVGVADDAVIRVGDTVRLKEANVLGTVASLSQERGQLEVQAGQVTISLGLDGVEKVAAPGGKGAIEPTIKVVRPASSAVHNELDLRGRRADEIEPAIDSYLNDAFMANLNQVRIVHGFGTGTVRKISRDFLASHPLAKSSRPGGKGEGGDGVTVVQL
jgi:DNA mismatch repair protein MutS2